MQSTFDERNWLVWLVRVRIVILTLLLAIELAVARFSPTPLPMRLFVSTILFWYSVSLFYVLLLSFWQEHRLQAGSNATRQDRLFQLGLTRMHLADLEGNMSTRLQNAV